MGFRRHRTKIDSQSRCRRHWRCRQKYDYGKCRDDMLPKCQQHFQLSWGFHQLFVIHDGCSPQIWTCPQLTWNDPWPHDGSYKLTSSDSHTAALCDWIFLRRYNGFWKSEWCNNHHTKYACIEDPLWSGPDAILFIAKDFSFFSPAGIKLSDIPNLSINQVGYSTILHCRQKNKDNFQTIPYG